MQSIKISIYHKGSTFRKGFLSVNGLFVCNTLEDADRNLNSTDPLEKIISTKVFGSTAIPYGKYSANFIHSETFGFVVVMLSGVKGFSGIEIHPGNSSIDTKGCILLGTDMDMEDDWIMFSRSTFKRFMELISKNGATNIQVEIIDGTIQNQLSII